MLVQEPEEIDDCRERGRLSAFIAREVVMVAAGETRGGDLAQAKLAADASDLLPLPLAVTRSEPVARRHITPPLSASNSNSPDCDQIGYFNIRFRLTKILFGSIVFR
jgi:hypothetical protein